jgi:hypothetical protein
MYGVSDQLEERLMEGAKPETNKDDRALMEYFLRGMRRFRKYAEGTLFEDLNRRIDAAYLTAVTQFAKESN